METLFFFFFISYHRELKYGRDREIRGTRGARERREKGKRPKNRRAKRKEKIGVICNSRPGI